MAAKGETGEGDLSAHVESYGRFIGWLKFGTIASAAIAVLVIILITW